MFHRNIPLHPQQHVCLRNFVPSSSVQIYLRTNGSTSGNAYIGFDVSNVNGWGVGIDNSDSQKFKIVNSSSFVTSAAKLTITTAGNVGIGAISPAFPIDISAGFSGTTNARFGTKYPIYTVCDDPCIAFNSYFSGSWKNGSNTTGNSYGSYFDYSPSNGTLYYSTSPSAVTTGTSFTPVTLLTVTQGGYVGIGTTSPGSLLHVYNGGIQCGNTASTSTNYEYICNTYKYGGITVYGNGGCLGYNITTNIDAGGWRWRFVDNTAAAPGADYFYVLYSSGNSKGHLYQIAALNQTLKVFQI
jgi:hypothetical protein